MGNAAWTTGPPDLTNTASFRAWGSGISTGLAAAGMTLVESGINWSTVTDPTTAEQERGFEIWRFPGALHSTAPIFIRFGYGSGDDQLNPKLTVKVGTTNPSSGVIGGVATGTLDAMNGGSRTTTHGTFGSWCACDGDGLALALHPGSSTTLTRAILVIDRFRFLDGEPTDEGVAVVRVHGGTSTMWYDTVDLIADEVRSVGPGRAPCLGWPDLGALEANVDTFDRTQVHPWQIGTRSGHYLLKMLASMAAFDVAEGTTQDVEWLPESETRTLRAVGLRFTAGNVDAYATAGLQHMTWWADPA